MYYRLEISRSAQQDLDDAARYIALQLRNLPAARNLLQQAFQAIDSLEEFPARFPVVRDPVLAGLGIRFLPVQGYLAFYRVDEAAQTVHILRFLYGKSNWSALLKMDLPAT